MSEAVVAGRFEIQEKIQCGQMADSFRALDRDSNKSVFLKVLRKAYGEDDEMSRRFQRESGIAAKIEHPNVVKLVDSGESDGSFYICFEWQEGISLARFIKRKSREQDEGKPPEDHYQLSFNEAARICREILRGLAAVHHAGVIHRDLKPSNILYDNDGGIHIADFSLAYTPGDFRITSHGSLVGTPAYLAPEIIAGGNPSAGSDLFSVGIIFFELITGKTLFEDKDIYTTLQNVHEAEIPVLSGLIDEVTPEIDRFLHRLLARHPGDRFSSVEEALEEFETLNIDESNAQIVRPARITAGKSRKKNIRLSIVAACSLIIIGLVYLKFSSTVGVVPISAPIDTTTVYSTDSPAIESRPGTRVDSVAEARTQIDSLTASEPIRTTHEPEPGKAENIQQDNEKIEPPAEHESTGSSDPPEELLASTTLTEQDSVSVDFVEAIIPPVDSVTVMILVEPWAKLYCNDIYLGTTPLIEPLRLPVGECRLKFENDNFPVLEKAYQIRSVDQEPIDVKLVSLCGRVEVTVIPWGDIFINGEKKGTAPMTKPVYVLPGDYDIQIRHPAFPEETRTVHVNSGETVKLAINFTENSN